MCFHTIPRMETMIFPTREIDFLKLLWNPFFNLIQSAENCIQYPTGTMSPGKESHKTSIISTQHPAGWSQIRFSSFSWEFKGVRPNNSELPIIILFLNIILVLLWFYGSCSQTATATGWGCDLARLFLSNFRKNLSLCETCFGWGFKEIEQHLSRNVLASQQLAGIACCLWEERPSKRTVWSPHRNGNWFPDQKRHSSVFHPSGIMGNGWCWIRGMLTVPTL